MKKRIQVKCALQYSRNKILLCEKIIEKEDSPPQSKKQQNKLTSLNWKCDENNNNNNNNNNNSFCGGL